MSFDLGVWYPQKRIPNKEAEELYIRLCEGTRADVVAHPAVDKFYAELTARHPEIDTIPENKIGDHDHCPWSCALDHSPGHVILSCVWPKATYVHQLVHELANKHGLAVYDPQSDVVTYPDGSAVTKKKRSSLWILGAFAVILAATFAYSAHIAPSGTPLYGFAGLCVGMAAVCFRNALK